jgi:hypothetical protein
VVGGRTETNEGVYQKKMHHARSTPHDLLLCGLLPACSTVTPGSMIRYDPPNNPDNGSSLRVTQPSLELAC